MKNIIQMVMKLLIYQTATGFASSNSPIEIQKKTSLKTIKDFKPPGKKLREKWGDHIVNVEKRSCSCPIYLKRAICNHSLAYSNSIMVKLVWFQLFW
jgi:hypothetical protein